VGLLPPRAGHFKGKKEAALLSNPYGGMVLLPTPDGDNARGARTSVFYRKEATPRANHHSGGLYRQRKMKRETEKEETILI